MVLLKVLYCADMRRRLTIWECGMAIREIFASSSGVAFGTDWIPHLLKLKLKLLNLIAFLSCTSGSTLEKKTYFY